MADDKNVVKQIVWGEVFSFPHIFKSFKMAIQPGKLALAVVALALIFGGGYVLDWVWCITGTTVPSQLQTPQGRTQGAIAAHATISADVYDDAADAFYDKRLEEAAKLYKQIKDDEQNLTWWIQQGGVFSTPKFRERRDKYNDQGGPGDPPVDVAELVKKAKDDGDSYKDILAKADDALDNELEKVDDLLTSGDDDLVDELEDKMEEDIEKASQNDGMTKEQADRLREQHKRDVIAIDQAITARKAWYNRQVDGVAGYGIFKSFAAYEANCLNNAMMSLWNLNFRGGLCQYYARVQGRWFGPVTADVPTGLPAPTTVQMPNEQPGFLYYMLMAAEGFRWMILQHWLYAIVFLLWTMAVCSLFGGAIYRMTALHFAREEKISIGQGLKFSKSKFLSFFFAPLVPIIVIVLTGLFISLGGFIFSLIPVVGPILLGLLFVIAILLAVGIAFMTIGLAAGWPLMYPTIAVEGSDSFDAISRSFSYVFARPFRAVLYGAIAAVYGMITYLFVRLFAYIALAAAHCFCKLGFWDLYGNGDRIGSQADMIDAIWQKPTFWDLQTVNWAALDWDGKIAAILVGLWVAIVVGAVLGYVLTYFAAASTSVYYILRRRVDATDLDDVYIEEEEEPITPTEEEAEEKAEAEEAKEEETSEEEADAEEGEKEEGNEEKSE